MFLYDLISYSIYINCPWRICLYLNIFFKKKFLRAALMGSFWPACATLMNVKF